MASIDVRMSLMAFPQRWDGAQLDLNILIIPRGNPILPQGADWPAFAGANLPLQVVFRPGLDQFPKPSDPAALLKLFTINQPAPLGAALLYQKLIPPGVTVVPKIPKSLNGVQIKKALPKSYIQSFPFERPRKPFLVIGDGYGCAIRGKNPGEKKDPPPKETSWGELLSYALRRPELGRSLGLLYNVKISVDPAAAKNGGWIYATLDTSDTTKPYVSGWKAHPERIQRYAARLPELVSARQIFAPVLFPVVDVLTNESLYDEALIEAQDYSDGFAKIMHCHQPTSADAAVGNENDLPAATDAGIQIGWDDEQVAIWHDRQLKTASSKQSGDTTDIIEAPLGVLGYRVDVREAGQNWQSLTRVKGNIHVGALNVNFESDQTIEPVPVRSQEGADLEAWLPQYFAQWRGKSLAVSDEVAYQLTGGGKPLAKSFLTPLLPNLNLLYGHTYEFRTRLGDLSGGGPDLADDPKNPAQAPIYQCKFQRFVAPKSVRLVSDQQPNPTKISVWRPLMGYPEFTFSGITQQAVIDKLLSLVRTSNGSVTKSVLGVTDPDVKTLRILVEAKAPAHDMGNKGENAGDLDGAYRVLYTFERSFPPLKPIVIQSLDPSVPLDPNEAIQLIINYIDEAQITNLSAPVVADPQPLSIPRGRDVRIRFIPIGKDDPGYFGTEEARIGITTDVTLRREALSEVLLLKNDDDIHRIRAMFLQPGKQGPHLLAQHLNLDVNGMTFSGKPGRRVVFGASGALRHTLSGDHSEITFTNEGELLNHWIVAIQFELDRDWTWDGLADSGFLVERGFNTNTKEAVGAIHMRSTVSSSAVAHPRDGEEDRRKSTQFVFFDAVDPNPPFGSFPDIRSPKYTVTPTLKGGITVSPLILSLDLPVASPPRQTPKIVAAGIALSPYQHNETYSATAPRQKALWIEFAEPPLDPHDTYFCRVLAYGPDPLLINIDEAVSLPTPVEPPLAIDPEPIRIITPKQTEDRAGLDAMIELIPSTESPCHYLVPLPPGIDENALELFGFWTYELRLGHKTIWSTAHGRFGRPLRATGIQHPSPLLNCVAGRSTDRVIVSAPYATAVLNGKNLTQRKIVPSTKMWALLYAQVMRSDGQEFRNILLLCKPAPPKAQSVVGAIHSGTESRDILGLAIFLEKEIEARLLELSLPKHSPLSVLAVELLPGGQNAPQDPLGADLGTQRILRTSPLVPVPTAC